MAAGSSLLSSRGPTWACVAAAAQRLENICHRTAVLESSTLNAIAGRELYSKAEALQKTGSFKARGALNAVLRLPKAVRGVVTHSAGNHGQALAWAAQQRPGLACAVVVPQGTAQVKMDAIRGYGAELHVCEPTVEARSGAMDAIALERGWTCVPPYNHEDVIAGQGTLAWEFCEQLEEMLSHGLISTKEGEEAFGLSILDAVIVPVSGGGLAAGVALAMQHLSPATRVFCVAPEGKALEASLRRGSQEPLPPNSQEPLDTICDGMRTRPLGALTFPLVQALAEPRVIEVSDEEVRRAMRLTMERLKIVVEPSGASALAAALKLEEALGEEEARSLRRVGLVMCGGNADLAAATISPALLENAAA